VNAETSTVPSCRVVGANADRGGGTDRSRTADAVARLGRRSAAERLMDAMFVVPARVSPEFCRVNPLQLKGPSPISLCSWSVVKAAGVLRQMAKSERQAIGAAHDQIASAVAPEASPERDRTKRAQVLSVRHSCGNACARADVAAATSSSR
jgi:hypothetical protein